MEELKKLIFAEIKKDCVFVGHTDEQLDEQMFVMRGNLRLSFSGFIMLKKIFTAHSFEILKPLKAKHMMALSTLEYPYYHTPKRLILFSTSDSLILKLSGGTEQFLDRIAKGYYEGN
jgi:hypothetical protein